MNSFEKAKEIVKQRNKKKKGKKAILDWQIFEKDDCKKKPYSDSITSDLDYGDTLYCLFFPKAEDIFKTAVLSNQTNVVKNLLEDEDVELDINAKIFIHLRTALHIAALNNQNDMMLLLLNRGADFSIKDEDGLTAVDYFKIIKNSR